MLHNKPGTFIFLLQGLFVWSFFCSCDKTKNPKAESEHDAITTVSLIFSQNNVVLDTFQFDDPDGVGGLPPRQLDTLFLERNQSYQVRVLFANKTKTPAVDVTPTIVQQGFAHEVYYLPNNLAIDIEKTDRDGLGFPLGLSSIWRTGTNTASGAVRVKLMHKPSVKGSNDSPNLGHSDVDVDFQTILQ